MTDDDHVMSEDCPCLPTVTIDGLIIHNSFDGREFDEIAAAIAQTALRGDDGS